MPPQPGAMRNRWTAYAVLSTMLAAGVVLKSLAQRPNFYSAAVYLSQSSANLMILCNLVFVTACTVLLFLQKLLYGPLRPIEVEQLYEKAWFAVTETCLAMTIFRGEIGAWFLVMFFSLLAGKVWGWIGEGRVEVLEQQQQNIMAGRDARLFHMRLAASLMLSVLFDSIMLDYVVGQVLHMARPDMMVMFGFEFAVLTVTSMSTVTRYGLNLIEIAIVRRQKQKRIDAIRKERVDAAMRAVQDPAAGGEQAAQGGGAELAQRRTQAAEVAAQQPIDEAEVEVEGWEGKGRWTFYLDLTTDFCKLVIYLSFFFILLIFYGLPLHIMRDVFLTCRSFFKRIGDFLRYRNATRDMNERYPDATEAEIGREDVCIICREDMRLYLPPAPGAPVDPVAERMRPKKLPCGHVLHFACLRSWLERQQICPTCRATVVPTPQTGQGAPGRAHGAAARPQHAPNGGNGRPRVFQLGPLRIGVGAVRGNDMFEQLEQQLANLNAPPAQGQGNAPQQYGFGIRWDGMRGRRANGNHRHVRGTVEDQLNAVERQIQREVDSLQAAMGELQALRNVQAQLASIRMARQAVGAEPQQPVAGQPLPQPNPQPRPAQPAVTSLVPNQQRNVLQAGSNQLPEGLTLPEGWTMMPLQPMQAPQMPAPVGFPQFPMMGAMPFMMPGAQGHVRLQQEMPQNATLENQIRQGASSAAQLQEMQMPNAQQARGQQQAPSAGSSRPPHEHAQAQQAVDQISANVSSRARQAATASQPEQDTVANGNPASAPRPTTSTTVDSQHRPQSQTSRSLPSASRPLSVQRPRPQSSSSSSATTSTNSASIPRSTATPTTRTPSVAGTTASVNAPQRLTPNMQSRPYTLGTNGARTSSTSPHRPQKSIGSSWGFSGVEDHDEDDDSDQDNEKTTDEEGEGEDEKGKAAKTNGKASRSAAGQRGIGKGRSPTVQDLVEDPD